MINMRNKISDIINNTKELLDLPFGKILIWKVDEFLGNSKELNVIGGNGAFLS